MYFETFFSNYFSLCKKFNILFFLGFYSRIVTIDPNRLKLLQSGDPTNPVSPLAWFGVAWHGMLILAQPSCHTIRVSDGDEFVMS